METEYFWWDLDKSRFKGVLYDSINVYFLHDHQYQNWDEFAAADPHMAYAHLTYVRFNALEQQFVDLRVIPQLLGVAPVPVKSSVKDINRYDWLKSISDLALFRFSSLRDIAIHFVNETMELGVPERKVNPIVAKIVTCCCDSGGGVQRGECKAELSFESFVTVH